MNPSRTLTSSASDSAHMSMAMYLAIMLAALVLGANAVHVNREYAFANLALLGLDAAALAVRQSAIDLLLLADIAIFFVAALMPRARFRALRGKLIVLGLLIWAFDCAHTYQARFGIVVAGQSTTAASTQRAADLRTSIDSLRATATSLRQSAARQSTSLIAASRADGSDSLRRAIEADQRADALSAELAAALRAKAPAEADIWGQWMPVKAFAESLLISMVGLLMFTLAGEMVRAARDAFADRRAARPAAPAPAPTAAPQPKQATLPSWRQSMPRPHPGYAAVTLPLASFAMAQPTPPAISVPAACQQAQPATPKHSTAPAAKVSTASTVKAASTVRTAAPRKASAEAGTVARDAAARHARIRSAVVAGTLKPSVRSLQQYAGGGTLAARRILEQLASEGLIERAGQGWKLSAAAVASSQLTLAGV